MKSSALATVVLAIATGVGCASDPSMPTGDDEPEPTCEELGNCPEVDPIDADPLVWTYVEVPGTKCIDGSPAGFSVNPNPDSTKLYIYMEGGGACFNDFCDSLFTWSGNTPNNTGIFDRENPANPVADWTLVYIPYCTGDVYGGDNEIMLGGEMRHFYGYSNHAAYVELLVASYEVDQVVLSGSSAGGFGALLNFAQTQDAYGDVPVTVIDDSGPPLSSDVFPPCLQQMFRETWGFDRTLLADCGATCDDENDYILDYLDQVREEYGDLPAGVFSSREDNTIRLFAGYGWSGGQHNSCGGFPSSVTGPVYSAGLDSMREHFMQSGSNLGTYFVPGNGHTVLRTSSFYTAGTDMTPAQWVEGTINGEAAHVGP